jgi:hypothetical protein
MAKKPKKEEPVERDPIKRLEKEREKILAQLRLADLTARDFASMSGMTGGMAGFFLFADATFFMGLGTATACVVTGGLAYNRAKKVKALYRQLDDTDKKLADMRVIRKMEEEAAKKASPDALKKSMSEAFEQSADKTTKGDMDAIRREVERFTEESKRDNPPPKPSGPSV